MVQERISWKTGIDNLATVHHNLQKDGKNMKRCGKCLVSLSAQKTWTWKVSTIICLIRFFLANVCDYKYLNHWLILTHAHSLERSLSPSGVKKLQKQSNIDCQETNLGSISTTGLHHPCRWQLPYCSCWPRAACAGCAHGHHWGQGGPAKTRMMVNVPNVKV